MCYIYCIKQTDTQIHLCKCGGSQKRAVVGKNDEKQMVRKNGGLRSLGENGEKWPVVSKNWNQSGSDG